MARRTPSTGSQLLVSAAFGLVTLLAPNIALAGPDGTPVNAPPVAVQPAPHHGGGEHAAIQSGLAAAGVTPEQHAQIKALGAAHSAAVKAVADRQTPAGRDQVRQLNEKYLADVKAVLRPGQQARFQAAYDEEMAWNSPFGRQLQILDLTAAEKSGIAPVLTPAATHWRDIQTDRSVPGKERRAEIAAIATDLKSKVRPLLTAAQQTQLDGLNLVPVHAGHRAAVTPPSTAPGA